MPLHLLIRLRILFSPSGQNGHRTILASDALAFERTGENLPQNELLQRDEIPGIKWHKSQSA
jgi:hypothetical protein